MLIFISHRINNTQFMSVVNNLLILLLSIICHHLIFHFRKIGMVEWAWGWVPMDNCQKIWETCLLSWMTRFPTYQGPLQPFTECLVEPSAHHVPTPDSRSLLRSQPKDPCEGMDEPHTQCQRLHRKSTHTCSLNSSSIFLPELFKDCLQFFSLSSPCQLYWEDREGSLPRLVGFVFFKKLFSDPHHHI